MGQEGELQDADNPEKQQEPAEVSPPPEVVAAGEEQKQETTAASVTHYKIGEQVDCQDEVNAWLNAEIIATKDDKVKVHFTGWHQKYDEWIDQTSSRIQPQWKPRMPFKVNNRIDVKDTYNKWMEAIIVEVRHSTIVVHYKGYTNRWDEELDMTSERIAQIGYHSTAYGSGKSVAKQDQKQKHDDGDDSEEDEASKKKSQSMEDNFASKLSQKSMRIKHVGGDGN